MRLCAIVVVHRIFMYICMFVIVHRIGSHIHTCVYVYPTRLIRPPRLSPPHKNPQTWLGGWYECSVWGPTCDSMDCISKTAKLPQVGALLLCACIYTWCYFFFECMIRSRVKPVCVYIHVVGGFSVVSDPMSNHPHSPLRSPTLISPFPGNP